MSKKNASTLVVTPDSITGTVADLTKGDKLRVNGQVVRQPEMSVLARLGLAQAVGTADRPEGKRGPAPVIYSLPLGVPGFAVARK